MSKSCRNFRAFALSEQMQSLAPGGKGCYPSPVVAMRMISKHVQVVSVGEAKLLLVEMIALSPLCVQKGVGDCGLISFATSHRNIGVCSFGVYHYTVSGLVSRPHFTFKDHIHLPVKLFFSQWENVLRSCEGKGIVFTLTH